MPNHKKILIVKHGALGDVVRTSFFAKPLHDRERSQGSTLSLYWLTATSAVSLLRFNPYIDVIATNLGELSDIIFDEVYSLDDETNILSSVNQLRFRKLVGARILSDEKVIYCDQSAAWFDMGLLSRFGKKRADKLKRLNSKTHSEIFKDIFQVESADFRFYNSDNLNSRINKLIEGSVSGCVSIGLNAFAGSRWKAKALPEQEFLKLVYSLAGIKVLGCSVHLYLIGSGTDLRKNQEFIVNNKSLSNVTALDTDRNVLELAAAVRSLKLLITTDSLCLHLAVAQRVPTVAFFSPTSSAEIERLPYIRKVISLSADYCSYKPDADNSTITSERIIQEVAPLLEGTMDA